MIPLRDDNPTDIYPWVGRAVLAACVLVFGWQLTLDPRAAAIAIHALGMIPAVLFGRVELPPEAAWIAPPLTVITSMFLHGGLWHLAGNMLYLWVFANNIEDHYGHVGFVVFYVVCGIAAALAQALPAADSQVPMIGASGAVSGVLGAYAVLYPRSRILVLIPLPFLLQLVRLPAAVLLALWFGFQLLMSVGAPDAGVAFRAHIGGFIAGVLIAFAWPGRRRRRR